MKSRRTITDAERRVIDEAGRAVLATPHQGLDWDCRADRLARLAQLRPQTKGSK